MLGEFLNFFFPENEVIETFLRGEVKYIDHSDDVFEVRSGQLFVIDFSDDVPKTSNELLLFFFERRDEFSGRDLYSYCGY